MQAKMTEKCVLITFLAILKGFLGEFVKKNKGSTVQKNSVNEN